MQLKPKLSDEILIKISPNSPGLNPNITGFITALSSYVGK